MDMKQIAVDLDVNRVIEAARQSFAETPNDILRRILLGRSEMVPALLTPASLPVPSPTPPATGAPLVAVTELDMPQFGKRTMGHWQAKVADSVVAASSLREAYCRFLVLAHQHDPAFLDRFSGLGSKARRYVARSPVDLYLKSPHLAKDHAVELLPGLYADTNLSESQIAKRARVAARELGLFYGTEAWIREATRAI